MMGETVVYLTASEFQKTTTCMKGRECFNIFERIWSKDLVEDDVSLLLVVS